MTILLMLFPRFSLPGNLAFYLCRPTLHVVLPQGCEGKGRKFQKKFFSPSRRHRRVQNGKLGEGGGRGLLAPLCVLREEERGVFIAIFIFPPLFAPPPTRRRPFSPFPSSIVLFLPFFSLSLLPPPSLLALLLGPPLRPLQEDFFQLPYLFSPLVR